VGYGAEDVPMEYERQVLFNAKLEQIAIIERPDKTYVSPLPYVASNEFKPPAPISDENAGDFMPFLELVIYFKPPNEPRYRVSFDSDEDLDDKFWRRIRETIRQALLQFKNARRPDGSWDDLFLPNKVDEAQMARKRDKIQMQREDAERVRALYARFEEEIERMARSGAKPEQIAEQYGLDIFEVKTVVNAVDKRKKDRFEGLAKEAMLVEMRKLGLHERYGIHDRDKLDHVILHRKRGNEFHKVKKDVVSRKPLIPASHVIPE
jgi:hypothetical protein